MNIVVTGGTGFIGKALCTTLVHSGHRVSVLTRNPDPRLHQSGVNVNQITWDGRDTGTWERALEGADAVINLAGAPIADARWTDARKRLITESRVLSTRVLVKALSRCSVRPATFISASGIGYYGGASDDRVLDEGAARGQGFLADLCLAWEAEALRAMEFGARVVLLRTGMVLEQDGGALPKMLLPFRLFAGGPIMPGSQWVSWIHRRDHIGLIQWALATAVSGPINAVAPEPVTMHRFCEALGRVLHRPSWLPVPEFALNMLLGELGTLMTTGQRVIPAKAMAGGYRFQYPTLESALQAILTGTTAASQAA